MRPAMQQRETYIRATNLIGLQSYLADHGLEARDLLIEVGLPPAALTNLDMLISFPRFCGLLDLAAERLDNPAVSVEWTSRVPSYHPTNGPLLMLAKFTADIEEWFETGIKYWALHTNGFTVELLTMPGSEIASIKYVPADRKPTPQWTEVALLGICELARSATGQRELVPRRVLFRHPPPAERHLHESAFGCSVGFEAPDDVIEFDSSILRLPTNGNLALLKPIVGLYVRHRLRQSGPFDSSMTATVAAAVASVAGSRRCNVEFIAESLGISIKKLQRLLAAEGTSFSEVLESTRVTIAKQLLRESEASIESVAGLLDYSSTAPFTTAFKRWTGQSPQVFRRNERSRSPER